MVYSVESLAKKYATTRASSEKPSEAVSRLYKEYIKGREQSLLVAAAAVAAINGIFLADRIDISKVTQQMQESFGLAFPNINFLSLAGRSPAEVKGFLSAWKGKYFEVIVRDELNAGKWVGDIHLDPWQTAVLAKSRTQSGWDLQIIDESGAVANELQLKATNNLSYVKKALERYPNIDILTTDEVLEGRSDAIPGILNGGLSDTYMEKSISAPMEGMLDRQLEQFFEEVLPGLPFIVIAVSEGRHVLVGRKSFEVAMQDTLYRAATTGVAKGVGAIVFLLDGGLLSVPASVSARLGLDRYRASKSALVFLDKHIAITRSLRHPLHRAQLQE